MKVHDIVEGCIHRLTLFNEEATCFGCSSKPEHVVEKDGEKALWCGHCQVDKFIEEALAA